MDVGGIYCQEPRSHRGVKAEPGRHGLAVSPGLQTGIRRLELVNLLLADVRLPEKMPCAAGHAERSGLSSAAVLIQPHTQGAIKAVVLNVGEVDAANEGHQLLLAVISGNRLRGRSMTDEAQDGIEVGAERSGDQFAVLRGRAAGSRGVQAHRVRPGTLARRERLAPGRAGPRGRGMREREGRRTSRRIRR